VPCTQPHTGEVFFVGDIWPQSLKYPGDKALTNQAIARCDRAFAAYDGIPKDQSAFDYLYEYPDNATWASGDRALHCIAYHPGAASIDHSIKGTNQ
jgi:hypothetical protein